MWEHAGPIAAVAGVILALIAHLVGFIWKLSRVEAAITKQLSEHQKETDAEFATVRREMGETGAALRQKINEVELWGRDNYVRREGFYKVKDELSDSIKQLGERLEKRLDTLNDKLDTKT